MDLPIANRLVNKDYADSNYFNILLNTHKVQSMLEVNIGEI